MLRTLGKRSQKAGLPPGSPVYVGKQKTEAVNITVIDYDADYLDVRNGLPVEACRAYKDHSSVTWINVDGVHEPAFVAELGENYGVHPLIVEDILNTQQRLKVDVFPEYLLIVLKMHRYDEATEEVIIEQVSLVLGHNFVLTFQEQAGDVFDALRERLRNQSSRLRKSGADYLAYALVDAVVDSYFELVEYFGEQIEAVEETLLDAPDHEILHSIHFLKRELLFFRKSVWPLRMMMSELQRQELPFIHPDTALYFRDLYDHIIQVIDTIETLRDMVTGILDIYLSSASNKMNEVMQFLTIIGTIFIPLTFIAGIYGMNFAFMPELQWKWGYFTVLGGMVVIGLGLLLYFKRKHWL